MSKSSHPQTLEQAEARVRGGHERSGGGGGGGFFAFLHIGQKSEAEGQYHVTANHMNQGLRTAQEAMSKVDQMRSNRWDDGATEAEHKPGEVAMLLRQAANGIIEGARGQVGKNLTLVSKLKIDAKAGDISKALRAVESEMSRIIENSSTDVGMMASRLSDFRGGGSDASSSGGRGQKGGGEGKSEWEGLGTGNWGG